MKKIFLKSFFLFIIKKINFYIKKEFFFKRKLIFFNEYFFKIILSLNPGKKKKKN
jgi:hypothetical protein